MTNKLAAESSRKGFNINILLKQMSDRGIVSSFDFMARIIGLICW
jgi:hypothetical protein